MDPNQAPQDQQAGGNDVEQRIDSLVSRFHDANEKLEASASLNEKYLETISGLQAQVASLEQKIGQGAGEDPLAALYAASTEPKRKQEQPVVTGAQFSNILRETIKAELAPVIEREEARTRKEESRLKQQAAFAQVAQDYPELGDQNSAEFRAFASLVNRTPEQFEALGELGPALYGLAAKQLAVGTAADQRELADRKRVADITRPSHAPTAQRQRATIPQSDQNATKAQEYIAQLQEKGERTGWNDTDMGQYLALKLGRYQQ